MKGWITRSVAIAGTFAFCSALQPASAGVLDILRGEPAEPQRVAFVGSAEVKSVQGEVMRLTGIDRWSKLPSGATLLPGDVVRAQEGGAVLQMKESLSFVKITPNTIVRLVPIEEGWDRAVLSGREENQGFIVRSCRGNAVVEKNGQWIPVEVNSVIARGTDVRTSPGAVVDLFDTQLKQAVRIQGPVRLTLDSELAGRRVRTAPSLASVNR
jgi:hypothetical protein